jgi:WD40 repeat protein
MGTIFIWFNLCILHKQWLPRGVPRQAFLDLDGKQERIQLHNKSLNCVDWVPQRGKGVQKLICAGSGGTIFTVSLTPQRTLELDQEYPQAHADQIRDIKCCPSILTKSPLIVSVGEDKRVCVWTWSEEGITLARSLDIGRSLYRLAWSFTGQFCYVATQDTPLVLALDKDRENLIEV